MIVASFMALPASAALVMLNPQVTEVLSGEQFEVAVYMNVTDAQGDNPGDIWGKIEATFNDALVQYDGFSLANNTSYKLSGLTENSDNVIVDFETVNKSQGRVGLFTFTALAGEGATLNFGIEDSGILVTSFFNTSPSNQPINDINFRGAEASVVPIPAAAWLFGSGLVGLLGWARRRTITA
jgi:hypothetical protein